MAISSYNQQDCNCHRHVFWTNPMAGARWSPVAGTERPPAGVERASWREDGRNINGTYLVGGLEHGFYFPLPSWDDDPIWRTHIFQGGWNQQLDMDMEVLEVLDRHFNALFVAPKLPQMIMMPVRSTKYGNMDGNCWPQTLKNIHGNQGMLPIDVFFWDWWLN